LAELSFSTLDVWSTCRLVELVLVGQLSLVELTDYPQIYISLTNLTKELQGDKNGGNNNERFFAWNN
jgi:hypothetical protein